MKNPIYWDEKGLGMNMKIQSNIEDTSDLFECLDFLQDEDFYKEILKAVPDFLWVKDLNGKYVYANSIFSSKFMNLEPSDVIGKDDLYFKEKSDCKKKWESCILSDKKVLDTQKPLKMIEESFVDGKEFFLEVLKVPWFDKEGRLIGTCGVGRDMTSLYETRKILIKKAFFDDLTGLYNKNSLLSQILKLIDSFVESRNICAAIFIDIDDFKDINKELGFACGDEYLVNISEKIKKIGEIYRAKIVRYDGDEFVFLLNTETQNPFEARRRTVLIAEQLWLLFLEDICFIYESYKTARSTCSVGVFEISDENISPDEVKSNLDIAIDEAKKNGKNNVVFYTSSLRKNNEKKLETERRISRAIRKGGFVLFLQPQYKKINQKYTLVGCEALIRMVEKEKIIYPCDFIDIAEENGQIVDIGHWVIIRAVEILREFQRICCGFEKISLSINISPKHFELPNFTSHIEKYFFDTNIDPSLLKIELTENAAFENFTETKEKMDRLCSDGFRLSLDDFGVGYSSLKNLFELPFSQIKIDKSFVDNIEECSNRKQVITSIKDLCSHMDKEIIIEGIETKGQLELLESLGVECFQGYYFGKPMKFEQFIKLPLVF